MKNQEAVQQNTKRSQSNHMYYYKVDTGPPREK